MEKNPLGSWSDLKPSITRQVGALIKAKLLMKIRNKSTMIEIFFSFFIIIIAAPAYFFTSSRMPEDKQPKIESVNNQSIIEWFSAYGEDTVVVCIPDHPLMHYLIGNTTILKTAIEGGTVPNTNITFTGSRYSYVNTEKELEKTVFLTSTNAVGFQWENVENEEERFINPSIKISLQTAKGNPQIDFFLELRNSIVSMKYLMNDKNGYDSRYETSLSLKTSIYKSKFAHPEIERGSNSYSFTYGIIASLVIVIATMPDMDQLFEDKHNQILAFQFLMGMSETAFWIANFVVSFIVCVICYIVISIILVFWFGMKGNDFSMVLIVSLFYILSELSFQFFLSTFIHNPTNGRWMTISLLMIGIASGVVFQFTALDQNSGNSFIVVSIFSPLPISAYQFFVMQGSLIESDHLPPYKWNDMKNTEYPCPPWYPLFSIILDFFLYSIFFLILNALLPRQYGSQPFKIKELLSKKKKNIILMETRGSDNGENEHSETVIKVENLTKKYKQMKDEFALQNVSFDVKKGEVILIVGPNGAGKSTIINCLSGIIHQTEGNISISDDFDPPSIGVCYQKNLLINDLTTKEHLDLFAAFRGVPQKTLKETVSFYDQILNISQFLNHKAGTLSGGQKRKLSIALALLGNPRIILMDEPTACVDVQGRFLIWKTLSNLENTTSIVVSHELEEAEFVSSRFFILNEGKISFSGTSNELKKEYKCGYVLRLNFEKGGSDSVLKLAQEFIPEAEISEDREDVIRMPDSNKISDFLFALSEKKTELGVKSYTFSVEQFEDVLMNLVYN